MRRFEMVLSNLEIVYWVGALGSSPSPLSFLAPKSLSVKIWLLLFQSGSFWIAFPFPFPLPSARAAWFALCLDFFALAFAFAFLLFSLFSPFSLSLHFFFSSSLVLLRSSRASEEVVLRWITSCTMAICLEAEGHGTSPLNIRTMSLQVMMAAWFCSICRTMAARMMATRILSLRAEVAAAALLLDETDTFGQVSSVSVTCGAIFEKTAMVGGGDLRYVMVLKGRTVRWEK